MALQWRWNEKCGEATFTQEHEGEDVFEYTCNLYVGNATLIFIHEWKEGEQEKYSVSSFWVDKQHMKNCLGLNKKDGYTENIYASPYNRMTKIRLNKAKCRNTAEIVSALVKAFDTIQIELF